MTGAPSALLDDLIDDPVFLGFLGRQDLVALNVFAHRLNVATRVGREHVLQQSAHPQDLIGLDLDVLSLATALAVGLVDQHARVLQGKALARRAGSEQHSGGRCRLPHADGLDVGLDEAHRVVDRG